MSGLIVSAREKPFRIGRLSNGSNIDRQRVVGTYLRRCWITSIILTEVFIFFFHLSYTGNNSTALLLINYTVAYA